MSYHEIEDAVESIVQLIQHSSLGSEVKKQRIQEIFSFQALFDTSDTLARVQEILSVYGLNRDTLYLKNIQVLPLFADILEIAIVQDKKLTREIYSIFLNAYLGGEIGEENAIPQEASKLSKNQDFLKIRNILQMHPELCKKDARSEESDEYDVFPDISFEIQVEKNPEKRAVLCLLAEPKKSISQILAVLEKELSKKTLSDPWKIVYTYFQQELGESYTQSQVQSYKDEIHICFLKKIPHAQYHEIFLTFCIFLNAEEKNMQASLGFQFSEIFEYQKRGALASPELQHDIRGVDEFFDAGDDDKNSHTHWLGGWKYDISKSEKVLLGHCENMISLFQKHESEIIATVLGRLGQFESFSLKQYQKELQTYQNLDIIPKEKHFPFSNMEGILAYLILFHRKRGNTILSQAYRDIFSGSISARVSEKRKQKHQDFVDSLDGKSDIFPEFFHTKNIFFDESQRTILFESKK